MRPFLSKIPAFLKPKRRWLQFSLRTLLVVTAIFALWLGWHVHGVQQRKEAVKLFHRLATTRDVKDDDLPVDSPITVLYRV